MIKLSKWTISAGAGLAALALVPSVAAAQDLSAIKPSLPLLLKGEGSFFMPGTTHLIDAATARGGPGGQAGLAMINQMYVQFMMPLLKTQPHYPIAIVHGCCLSTKSWQTTPDGRMGWDEYFVRQGFDTYMIDQVGRARSGFDATEYNDGADSASLTPISALPAILIATDQFAWNVFRWGTTLARLRHARRQPRLIRVFGSR